MRRTGCPPQTHHPRPSSPSACRSLRAPSFSSLQARPHYLEEVENKTLVESFFHVRNAQPTLSMLACLASSHWLSRTTGTVHTGAQTQDLNVVAGFRSRQSQYRRSKEHGLVIGVSNEQADALVVESRESRLNHADGVHVQNGNHHHQGRQKTEHRVHVGGEGLVVIVGSC